jgi:hypothetical protein
MVTNHDDAVFDHHPTPTRGFTETVNWALKHAENLAGKSPEETLYYFIERQVRRSNAP